MTTPRRRPRRVDTEYHDAGQGFSGRPALKVPWWKGTREWRAEGGPILGLGLIAPAVALWVLLFAFPLVVLISTSVPALSLGAYATVLTSTGDSIALARTLLMAILVTAACLIVGGFLAWEMRTSRSSLKTAVLAGAVIFPLWTSLIVRNYSISVILQRRGIINEFLMFTGLRDEPAALLYTPFAVFIGMLYIMLPFGALPLYAVFRTIDLDLVRAAQNLGASPFAAFRSVVLPLALPGTLATGALVFVLAVGFYVTPLLLGGAESPFIPSRIATSIFVLFDLPRAAAASTILLVVVSGCLALTWRLVGAERLRRALEGA